jgi:hypothetical protein
LRITFKVKTDKEIIVERRLRSNILVDIAQKNTLVIQKKDINVLEITREKKRTTEDHAKDEFIQKCKEKVTKFKIEKVLKQDIDEIRIYPIRKMNINIVIYDDNKEKN